MPQVVNATSDMIRQMAPELGEGVFAFRTFADWAEAAIELPEAIGMFREKEGVSLIVGSTSGSPDAMRQITLSVYSALDGVGLTAAASSALAKAGIACNMVAAYHHDHIFVPESDAERALQILRYEASTHNGATPA